MTAPFFTALIRDSCQCEGSGGGLERGMREEVSGACVPGEVFFFFGVIYFFNRVETQRETCEEDGPTFLFAAPGSHLVASSCISV